MTLEPILLRGGGDLASGIALRLHRAGLSVLITELPYPLAVRRTVAFSDAVYSGLHMVEGVTGRLVQSEGIASSVEAGEIPVLVDPEASILESESFRWAAVVDARMLKVPPAPLSKEVPLLIGLGPGFEAGVNCDAVVETRRSHTLGRVFWEGKPQPDSGLPEGDPRRVLRAPRAGLLEARARIGEMVEVGQVLAVIHEDGDESPLTSPLRGILRGLIHEGLRVEQGMKIGDVDVRGDRATCLLVSDKALAVGGGVLEAILTHRHGYKPTW